MSKLPLKYCEQIKEALRYVDDYKLRNVNVVIRYNESVNVNIYEIYHYNTLIAVLTPKLDEIVIIGGYSASDRDIINSFLILFEMSNRVARTDKLGIGLYVKQPKQ